MLATGTFLILFTLKLLEVIDWSWWIVALPLILQFSIILFAVTVAAFIEVIRGKL